MSTIVIGVDAHPSSRHTAAWAAEHAQADARVVAVCAQQGTWFLDAFQADTDAMRRETERQLNEEWVKPFIDAGIHVDTVQHEGAVAAQLASVAADVDADFIVIGHHVDPKHRHRRLGSILQDLLKHAERPVVVVPWVDDA
jgi:nucleotide-binding universal stress UspA family protein